ncbi:hypothetical protein C7271_16530 [filamentous cyanobacterium CCP5]|nr:hypothetical protein C7271_16530 [filamentous cyanobacterium CCP5]
MNSKHRPCRAFLGCLLLASVLSTLYLPPAPVEAQSWWQRITAPVRKNPDLCPPVPTPLTALVPNRNQATLTGASYPSFWFYVPYRITPDATEFTLKFVLQDDSFRDIYTVDFSVPEAVGPGILSLQLSSEKAALAVGKSYHWYFLIYCNDQQQVYEPAFVEGAIQRGELSQPRFDENAGSPSDPNQFQDQLQVYAESNVWHEFFDTLALELWTNPNQPGPREGWSQTLEAIELENLEQKPIVGRYVVPDLRE